MVTGPDRPDHEIKGGYIVMRELTVQELYFIDGGEKTISDHFLFAGAIAACFVSPALGVPLVVAVWVFT